MPENQDPIIHTIHLVRHGQCIANLTSQTLPPEVDFITELGCKQADALGDHLKDVEFTKAYASTYQRAHETAKRILAKSNKPCAEPLKTEADIRERELEGTYGLPKEEIDAIRIGGNKNGVKYCELEIPGCEKQTDFGSRIRRFYVKLFESLKESKQPETILIVSHGLTIQRFLFGMDEGGLLSDIVHAPDFKLHNKKLQQGVPNTANTIFTLTYSKEEGKLIVKFNQVYNTAHLQ